MAVGARASRRLPSEAVSVELFLRRKLAPRRASRRPLRLALRVVAAAVLLAGVVAVGYWTAAAAGRAPELAVSRIRVEGNQRLAEGEILEGLGLHPDSNILSLDLESLRSRLLRSPWVKDVQLTRMLPATLTVRVVERVPVGIAVLDRLYLIDEEGVFLDEMGPRYADLTLPLVSGIFPSRGRPPEGRTELAVRVLRAVAEEDLLEAAISEIDLSGGPGSTRVVLRHPPLEVLVDESDMVARLKEMLPLLEAILHHFPSLEAVDLRFEGRVYLRLAEETAPAATTAERVGR